MDNPLSDQQRQQIAATLNAGRKLDAVKLYRDFTGANLTGAVRAIDAFDPQAPAATPTAPQLSEADQQRLNDLLAAGQTVQAIKLFRELTGLSLQEAKQAIDAMTPASQRRTGCAGILLLALPLPAAILLLLL